TLDVLKVDGGVTANDLCMQLQADILGVPVSRPVVAETTALGAAYAAGLTAGFWRDTAELRANWHESRRWEPTWSEDRRAVGYVAAVLGEGPYWRPEDEALLWVDVVRGHLHMTRVQVGETITIELDTVSAAFPAVGGGFVTAGGHRLLLRATRPGEGWAGRIIAEAPARDG